MAGFLMHQRHSVVQQLAFHLENGQRAYFTNENVVQMAQQPREKTPRAFFKLGQVDNFARTLQYPEIPSYYT